jgi:hypothetical protein
LIRLDTRAPNWLNTGEDHISKDDVHDSVSDNNTIKFRMLPKLHFLKTYLVGSSIFKMTIPIKVFDFLLEQDYIRQEH